MENRISGNLTIILVLLAVCLDLSQAFLEWILIGFAINPILDIGVGFLFHQVFKSRGVNFKGTIALVFFGLAFLEFVPVVAEFPLWTIDIIAVILLTKAEDKLVSKVGSSKAGVMMRDPARLRRIGRMAMNNINKVPMLKQAMDKKTEGTYGNNNDQTVHNNAAEQDQENISPEKMRWQSQNKQKNNPKNQRLGSGSKENIKKDDLDNKRQAKVEQQRKTKQNRIDKSNDEEYENKNSKATTSNQDYGKQKTFRFDNDFGRQNDSSRPQSERDIINRQRQAKFNRPKNNVSEEFKKAA